MFALLEKPWSIICRNATGRLSVAVDEHASATSQAANNPRCARTNGHNARKLPTGALLFDSGESAMPPIVEAPNSACGAAQRERRCPCPTPQNALEEARGTAFPATAPTRSPNAPTGSAPDPA